MNDWSEDDVQAAMTYGICEYCGGPRDLKVERSETEVMMRGTCRRCGREPT